MTQRGGRTVRGMGQGSAAARSARPSKQAVESVADAVDRIVVLDGRRRAAPAEPAPDPADEATSALDAVLAELGGISEARVMVYRFDRGGAMQYVATMTPEEVQSEASLLEHVRQEFGGGTYRIHVRDGSGLIANRRIDIAERKQPGPDAGLSSIAALFERQAQQFERTLQALMPRASAAESEDAMLSRLKIMSEIVRGDGGSQRQRDADPSKMIELLLQGIAMGKEMQPAGGAATEDVLVSALSAFAPVIAEAAKAKPAPVRRPAAAAPAVPVKASPAAASPAPTAAPAEEQEDQAEQLRALLALVLRAARADSDPGIYVGMVIDQVGEENVALLLEQPDPLGMLAKFEPAVAEHREWFERLLNEVGELLNAEETDSRDADGSAIGPRGGAPDAADHAALG